MNTNIQTIINAIGLVGVSTIDNVASITGLSKKQIHGHMVGIKKEGIATLEKGTITLTDHGLSLIEQKNAEDIKALGYESVGEESAPNDDTKEDEQSVASASTDTPISEEAAPQEPAPVATEVVKPTPNTFNARPGTKAYTAYALLSLNTTIPRKEKIAMLMTHAKLTNNGASTYIYNFDKLVKEAAAKAAQQPS